MPFTPSHAAAVLPLLGTRLPASALVAGSVAPDLPYYLPVELGVRTHTAAAVVGADLLLGLLLWAVWHGVVAAPGAWTLRSLSPIGRAERKLDAEVGLNETTLAVA